MFESFVCLVQSVIPHTQKSLKRIPPRKIFTAKEYNASIEYFWAPFIVESNSDNATNHSVVKRSVKLDSIAKHGKHWEGVHILVFQSYIWWMYKPMINATLGSPHNVQEYNVTTAYRLALETWANWVETSINPQNQKIYFVSMSPTHLWSWEWKPGSDGNCFNETHPIPGSYWGIGSNREIMEAIGDVLARLKIDVTLLNITQLAEFRKDGHTSVYGERRGKLLTREQRSDPRNFADCIHWCIPGVPDTWNEILYAHILKDYRSKNTKLSPAPS
ncbi:Protein trichome birefringence-like 31 [Sarracenia purpurea var. burkii]